MSKLDKLIEKLKICNNSFKWTELVSLLTALGYVQIQGDGSRVKLGSSQQRYRKSHRDWGIDLIYHAFCWFFTPRFD